MNSLRIKLLILVGALLAVSLAALAVAGNGISVTPVASNGLHSSGADDLVSLSASLTQDKLYIGSDGRVSMSLTMDGYDMGDDAAASDRGVDMVVVLDRSGSMQADKLEYAKKAMLRLLAQLGARDRLSIVSYSDEVTTHSTLLEVTPGNRNLFVNIINRIYASGNTNLGAGLQRGLDILTQARNTGNAGRLVLISDGLANEGVTDPDSLGRMASRAVESEFAISTVGVGLDFDEYLMTRIADMGTGRYYYLDNPNRFADTFIAEFRAAKAVVASSVEIRLPLPEGAVLEEAGGFPVTMEDGVAVFHPGELLSGQTRRIYLTLRLPVTEAREYRLAGLTLRYLHDGMSRSVSAGAPMTIAVVEDKSEAMASINGEEWTNKVLQEDYNRMREDVAQAVREGDMQSALGRIEAYEQEAGTVNEVVNSPTVSENLDKDLSELRDAVSETFAGAADEVEEKQQIFAKETQQDSYLYRRAY